MLASPPQTVNKAQSFAIFRSIQAPLSGPLFSDADRVAVTSPPCAANIVGNPCQMPVTKFGFSSRHLKKISIVGANDPGALTMLTYWWIRKLTRQQSRQTSLSALRKEAINSDDLSVKTLNAAPELWQRQHHAFEYLQRQENRLKKNWPLSVGGTGLAILGDLAAISLLLTLGGMARRQFALKPTQVPIAGFYNSSVTGLPPNPVAALRQQLYWPDIATQLNAVRQLGALRDQPQAVGELIEVALSPEFHRSVRQLAMQMLLQMEDPRQLALRRMQGNSDPDLRQLAALLERQLTDLQPVPVADPRDLTLQWIYEQGRSQNRQALTTLTRYLGDADPSIREAAVLSLAEIGDREALNAIRVRLMLEPEAVVRQALAIAIAQLELQHWNR